MAKVGSQKWKNKISKALKKSGFRPPSRLGIKHTKESKRKMSEALKKAHKRGVFNTESYKNRTFEWLKGGNTNALRKGYKKWLKENGGHLSEETKRKISENKKGKKRLDITGEKCHLWKGGISFEPYSVDWTKDLKRAIRKRDKYICQICGKEPAVYVHHIDYDKKNCNPKNLITLCHSCHSKTNHNRKKWILFFKR